MDYGIYKGTVVDINASTFPNTTRRYYYTKDNDVEEINQQKLHNVVSY